MNLKGHVKNLELIRYLDNSKKIKYALSITFISDDIKSVMEHVAVLKLPINPNEIITFWENSHMQLDIGFGKLDCLGDITTTVIMNKYPARKMTIEEIEEELDYKVEIMR